MALLDVKKLNVRYSGQASLAAAVNDLSFSIAEGEAIALVGESGCGKSTTALAIMRLLPSSAAIGGEVLFEGSNVAAASSTELGRLRGNRMAMIFQEPMTSLNPVHRIGDQIVESLRWHRSLNRAAARNRTLELLELVNLPDPRRRIDEYPHQLSGGQRQRVMIAMAIACEPKLLIADEPTTALDATVQAQILQLIDKLRRELSMGLLLISHDLNIVSRWTDRVVVMHHGERMEELDSPALFKDGSHPYTRGLIGASIHLDSQLHYTNQALSEIRASRDSGGAYSFTTFRRERPADQAEPAAAPKSPIGPPILEVDSLTVEYQTARGPVRAVEAASFNIASGETLGLVGESGSGKSTLSKAVMRLVGIRAGVVKLEGRDITRLEGSELRQARRRMQMIFQDPYGSLNPRHSVGTVLDSVLQLHGYRGLDERRKMSREVIDWVGLPRSALDRYPHEFSGGQRQRIAIARALVLKPPLIICDEPVSALDVSIQAQILNLLVDLKRSLNLSYLFISHDLAVVQYISDRVIVMKDSRIVEEGDHLEIWQSPKHPYTQTLIEAVASAPATAPEATA